MPPDLVKAIDRLKSLHPTARMWNHGEVDAGRLQSEDAEQSFILVSLYEHDITEHFRALGGYRFIISNGFLSSHAYNLALVWLQGQDNRELRRVRFRHNFKKFFAEVMLHRRDTMLGRALLLETLAYEQELMAPIFDAAKSNPQIEAAANLLASSMTGLAQHHELGHYFFARSRDEFMIEASKILDGVPMQVLQVSGASVEDIEPEEILCDAVAAHIGIFAPGANENIASDLQGNLRRTLFGLQAFYRLMNIRASALATAAESPSDDEVVSLGSEFRSPFRPVYAIGRSNQVEFRSRSIIRILEEFASRRGISIYGCEGGFPLSVEIWDDFDHAFENCLEEAPAGTPAHQGCDSRGRGVMRMVAEALSFHPRGIQHLLWRSKTFKLGGQYIDP